MQPAPIDPVARHYEGPLEYLGDIRMVQRPRLDGPMVNRAVLDLFHGSDARRAWADASALDRLALSDLGWTESDGTLTAAGASVRRDLRRDSVTYALCAVSADGETHATIVSGSEYALLIAESQPRPWGRQKHPMDPWIRFDVFEQSSVPLFLARWAGLAPAWSVEGELPEVDADLVEARLRDESVPVPPGTDPILAEVWSNPWVLWTVSCPFREIWFHYLDAGERGQHVIQPGASGRVRLVPRPGTLVWGELVQAHWPAETEDDGWSIPQQICPPGEDE